MWAARVGFLRLGCSYQEGKATAGGATIVAAAGREGREAGTGRWLVVVPASAAVAGAKVRAMVQWDQILLRRSPCWSSSSSTMTPRARSSPRSSASAATGRPEGAVRGGASLAATASPEEASAGMRQPCWVGPSTWWQPPAK